MCVGGASPPVHRRQTRLWRDGPPWRVVLPRMLWYRWTDLGEYYPTTPHTHVHTTNTASIHAHENRGWHTHRWSGGYPPPAHDQVPSHTKTKDHARVTGTGPHVRHVGRHIGYPGYVCPGASGRGAKCPADVRNRCVGTAVPSTIRIWGRPGPDT